MAIDIDSIFKAKAQSNLNFLITSGQCCYIPAYQRPYSWDNENVERLFEDALHGISLLKKRPDTISFLGTIIAINDIKHKTIKPIYKAEVPSKVMTIIDGQQRICTFLIVNIAFHQLVRKLARKFKNKEGEHFAWIVDQSTRVARELEETFVLDMRSGDDHFQYYPRVIRAYEDVWSSRKSQAKYESPIAKLIWDYFEHLQQDENKTFVYKPKDQTGQVIAHFKSVSDVFGVAGRKINQITGTNSDDHDFPPVLAMVQSSDFMEALWGFSLPDAVIEYVRDKGSDPHYDAFSQLVRLIVFSKYMNNRMAFTVVTTESEDDAFDMFEALNTTGEPLTAFETFKPKIIEFESLEKYEMSDSRKYIDAVELYLERFRKAEQKQKATSELLVPFALMENGEKLQKRLNEQRRWLREQYDGLKKAKEKRTFVQRLAYLSSFINIVWSPDGLEPQIPPIKGNQEFSKVGLEALRDLKHHVTVAPLARFYGEYLAAEDDSKKSEKSVEFCDALSATFAFSFLWRAAKGGTDNIDNVYRDIMRSGRPSQKIPPLSVRPKDTVGAISIANYKKMLVGKLADEGIDTKANWISKAERIPIYKHSKDVARFLLFLASHDAVPDVEVPGLLSSGREGVSPTLLYDRWNDKNYFTVEHIAPQSNQTEWDASLYEDPDFIHRIGNLLLLPQAENAVFGNRSWKHKNILFGLLSAESEEDFQSRMAELSKFGLKLSTHATKVVEQASFLPMCKSISLKKDTWDAEFVNKRSQRILERAWAQLASGLDLKAN
ncbi:DUF262 domain-containing protein [Kordiimonas aquimaris]|uniref:DUF262 domain-containing protein n=1 Tax=Kordiimonas aquimaris TaxID=707591 RepID=UPI0021CEDC74|nr:DUF262 domain-containing HNH endonuclease family protein [Kordiimonas aquimaris]